MSQYQPPFSITPKILNLVSQITESVTRLELLEPQAFSPILRKVNKIKTITGTLEIEGNTLGIEKITAILDGKRVLGSTREVAEVKGAIKVYDELDHFNYQSLDDLLLAHKILMGELLTKAGTFRTQSVGVGSQDGIVHVAPPANRVEHLMFDLFDWLKQSDIHPLIKSSVFHYEFEFIHPFIDGNGRVGRLWQSLILYRWKSIFSNIPIESMIKESQQQYYDALEQAGQSGDSTVFVQLMLETILHSCNKTLDDSKNVPINVPINVPLNRLEKIVQKMQQNKDITIDQLAEIFDVTSKTINRDITKLKEQGRVERIGSLKNGYWKINL